MFMKAVLVIETIVVLGLWAIAQRQGFLSRRVNCFLLAYSVLVVLPLMLVALTYSIR